MPKFHLSLRTRREFNIAYILNRPGIKWEIGWSSHALSSLTTSLPSPISDLDEQLGTQGSETGQTHVLVIAVAIVLTAVRMPTVCMTLCCNKLSHSSLTSYCYSSFNNRETIAPEPV